MHISYRTTQSVELSEKKIKPEIKSSKHLFIKVIKYISNICLYVQNNRKQKIALKICNS